MLVNGVGTERIIQEDIIGIRAVLDSSTFAMVQGTPSLINIYATHP